MEPSSSLLGKHGRAPQTSVPARGQDPRRGRFFSGSVVSGAADADAYLLLPDAEDDDHDRTAISPAEESDAAASESAPSSATVSTDEPRPKLSALLLLASNPAVSAFMRSNHLHSVTEERDYYDEGRTEPLEEEGASRIFLKSIFGPIGTAPSSSALASSQWPDLASGTSSHLSAEETPHPGDAAAFASHGGGERSNRGDHQRIDAEEDIGRGGGRSGRAGGRFHAGGSRRARGAAAFTVSAAPGSSPSFDYDYWATAAGSGGSATSGSAGDASPDGDPRRRSGAAASPSVSTATADPAFALFQEHIARIGGGGGGGSSSSAATTSSSSVLSGELVLTLSTLRGRGKGGGKIRAARAPAGAARANTPIFDAAAAAAGSVFGHVSTAGPGTAQPAATTTTASTVTSAPHWGAGVAWDVSSRAALSGSSLAARPPVASIPSASACVPYTHEAPPLRGREGGPSAFQDSGGAGAMPHAPPGPVFFHRAAAYFPTGSSGASPAGGVDPRAARVAAFPQPSSAPFAAPPSSSSSAMTAALSEGYSAGHGQAVSDGAGEFLARGSDSGSGSVFFHSQGASTLLELQRHPQHSSRQWNVPSSAATAAAMQTQQPGLSSRADSFRSDFPSTAAPAASTGSAYRQSSAPSASTGRAPRVSSRARVPSSIIRGGEYDDANADDDDDAPTAGAPQARRGVGTPATTASSRAGGTAPASAATAAAAYATMTPHSLLPLGASASSTAKVGPGRPKSTSAKSRASFSSASCAASSVEPASSSATTPSSARTAANRPSSSASAASAAGLAPFSEVHREGHASLRTKKRVWGEEEDAALLASFDAVLVAAAAQAGVPPSAIDGGSLPWSIIAQRVPGRTGKQCRERWVHRLQLGLVIGDWTPAEDAIILREIQVHGKKWVTIAEALAGRTAHAVKNRYYATCRKVARLQKKEAGGAPTTVSASGGIASGGGSGGGCRGARGGEGRAVSQAGRQPRAGKPIATASSIPSAPLPFGAPAPYAAEGADSGDDDDDDDDDDNDDADNV